MSHEHVVMLVHNSVVNDTRVLREAAWLARAGLEVTVLGRSQTTQRDIVPVDRALVARVPLSREITQSQSRLRSRRRAWRPIPAPFGTSAERTWARDLALALRESDKVRDEQSRATVRWVRRAARLLRRRSVGAATVLDGAMSSVWSGYDDRRSRSARLVRWRTAVGGQVGDFERSFGPVIDNLRPDVLHAHDVHMLSVAVHAARRAARRGRRIRVVYDAHEFVPGMAVVGRTTVRTIAGWKDLERRYIHQVDAVVTVGDDIAGLIGSHYRLADKPAVVLNVPVPSPPGSKPAGEVTPRTDVRGDCGLDRQVPLLVYSGGVTAVRGVDTAVAGLAHLPGVHLAVVCVPSTQTPVVQQLREQAARLGCADRLHLLEPVAPGRIVDYLRTADVGLIVMHGGWPNHEHAMPNKFFEYLRAGVPMVVSDLRCLGREVREEALGATFTPEDVGEFVVAVGQVLEDLDGARSRVLASRWRVEGDWRVQEARLRAAYRPLLGNDLSGAGRPGPDVDVLERDRTADGLALDARPLHLVDLPAADRLPQRPRLVLGPRNAGGSMSHLADVVRRQAPGMDVQVMMINPPDPALVDIAIRRPHYHRTLGWQITSVRRLLWGSTHVLFEDCLPIAGSAMGPTCLREARYLTHLGVRCAVLLHAPPQDRARAELAELAAMGVALLVSAPELLGAVPGARWLPRVDPHAHDPRAGEGSGRAGLPVVVAGDRTGGLLCRDAASTGLAEVYAGPVDPLGLPVGGLGGVDAVVLGGEQSVGSELATRTMGAGTLLVAGAQTVGPWLPLVDDAQELDWARRLQDDEACAALAATGPSWVREHHDGAFSTRVLGQALDLPVVAPARARPGSP